ncbi:MAG: glycosyltransferase, partial [Bacteroidetes bacterium]
MSAPRILAAHLWDNYSGSPRVFAQALTALAEERADIQLFTSDTEGFLNAGPWTRRVVPYRWVASRWGRLGRYLWSQLYLMVAVWRARKGADLVYVNTLLPFGAALAGKLAGLRVVYHLHETHVEPASLHGLLTGVVRRCADEVAYVSDYLARVLPFPGVPARIIPNALPAEYVSPGERLPALYRFEGLMVASLKAEKGLPAFAQLATDLPDLHFTLIVGAGAAELEAFWRDLPRPGNLTLLPAQKRVKAYYQRAHLLLNLSDPERLPETFGMTILEGMACGLPAIVPPTGGPAELVREGVEGYQVDSRDRAA